MIFLSLACLSVTLYANYTRPQAESATVKESQAVESIEDLQGSDTIEDANIENVFINNDGVYLSVNKYVFKPGCNMIDNKYIALYPSQSPFFKEIYSLLLSAHFANKKVTIKLVADSNNECTVEWIQMDRQ